LYKAVSVFTYGTGAVCRIDFQFAMAGHLGYKTVSLELSEEDVSRQ
jgi:hypothetical protein